MNNRNQGKNKEFVIVGRYEKGVFQIFVQRAYRFQRSLPERSLELRTKEQTKTQKNSPISPKQVQNIPAPDFPTLSTI